MTLEVLAIDRIVDLVDTGNTLKANGLAPLEHIADISAWLVANKASMKMKHQAVKQLVDRLERAVAAVIAEGQAVTYDMKADRTELRDLAAHVEVDFVPAGTVTGAPKTWAMQFIEDNEDAPRRWYGGAVGMLSLNGDINTGITIRTVHLSDGLASSSAGATLLYDSIPASEEGLYGTQDRYTVGTRWRGPIAKVESEPRFEGRQMVMILAPR